MLDCCRTSTDPKTSAQSWFSRPMSCVSYHIYSGGSLFNSCPLQEKSAPQQWIGKTLLEVPSTAWSIGMVFSGFIFLISLKSKCSPQLKAMMCRIIHLYLLHIICGHSLTTWPDLTINECSRFGICFEMMQIKTNKISTKMDYEPTYVGQKKNRINS